MRMFPDAEFDRRLERVRDAMREADVAVLLIGDPANMAYVTGFDGWTFYVPQLVMVEASGGPPTWFGRAMDVSLAEMTTELPGNRVVGYADELVDNVARHPMAEIPAIVRARGLDRERLAIELDAPYVTPVWYEAVRAGLPKAQLVDGWGLVNRVRSVKSDLEIEVMREAAAIAEASMRTAIGVTVAGTRENDAVAEIVRAQLRGTAAFGGDYPSSWPHYLVGRKAGMPHAPWSDEPLAARQAVAVELAGVRHRYHAALARTIVLSDPEPRLLELADAVQNAMEVTLATFRPGATPEEVEAAWREAMSSSGYVKSSRIGYSLGLGYPPSWIEHSISLRPGDRTVLEPNMTFHLILGMWEHGWGYELSETVRVIPGGAETLTTLPRRLFVGGETV